MALAQIQYTQTVAGNRNFTVPFPYISRDDIKVQVNGEDVGFVWNNASTVRVNTAPALGDVVDIRRVTERVNLLVTFNDGSTITEGQLVLASRQSFFIAQEAFDATGGTLSVRSDGSYSASGRRLRDVGTPQSDNDAATRKWVQDTYHQGRDSYAAQLASEAARDKARQWADNNENVAVETGRFSAKHHALKAQASATAAANSAASIVADELLASQKASEAAASATAAQTARTGAETARNAAQTAQTAAETARNAAQTAQTGANTARDTALAYRDQALSYRDGAVSAKNSAESARDDALAFRNTAGDHATAAATARTGAETARNTADTHRLNAAASATAASASASEANTHRQAAASSAAEAAGYAAGVNLPSAQGQGGKVLRQKSNESGLEYASLTWSLVENKPSTFTPSPHSHPWAEVTGAPATATRWPTWAEVTSKPSTFPPESHNHDSSYIQRNARDDGAYFWLRRTGVVGYLTRFGSTGNIAEWRYSADTTAADGSAVMSINTSGNLTCTGNVTAYSDRRVKENLEIITEAMAKVMQLNGYTFDRTDVEGPRQTGVVAQEVQAVLPEAVIEQEDGKLAVAYGNMVGLLIEAIKELKAEVDQLKEQLNAHAK